MTDEGHAHLDKSLVILSELLEDVTTTAFILAVVFRDARNI